MTLRIYHKHETSSNNSEALWEVVRTLNFVNYIHNHMHYIFLANLYQANKPYQEASILSQQLDRYP